MIFLYSIMYKWYKRKRLLLVRCIASGYVHCSYYRQLPSARNFATIANTFYPLKMVKIDSVNVRSFR